MVSSVDLPETHRSSLLRRVIPGSVESGRQDYSVRHHYLYFLFESGQVTYLLVHTNAYCNNYPLRGGRVIEFQNLFKLEITLR